MQAISVREISGVGSARAQQLQKLGIETVEDLFSYLPRDYRDLTQLQPLSQMVVGQPWFGLLEIGADAKLSYPRRGFSVVRAYGTQQDQGRVALLFYNMPYVKAQLTAGRRFYVYGKPSYANGEVRLANPMLESLENSDGTRMLPVYKLTSGLSQNAMRKCVKQAFAQFGDRITDELPRQLREAHQLYAQRDAYELAHFAPNVQARDGAVRTLSFIELLLLRCYLSQKRSARSDAGALLIDDAAHRRFVQALGFAPTGAQLRVMEKIRADMAQAAPMSRLVQGDVGSGKTAVAFYALYIAAQNGRQGVLMAPTELLAIQHAQQAQALFARFGVEVTLLRAGMKAAEKREALRRIQNGESQIVIGTHALIQKDVQFCHLGVAVADEQHRFGVAQRARLMDKGEGAHALFLSATPIPRTLSLILYGDLDLSVVDEMPIGRKPVQTRIVPPHKRAGLVSFLREQAHAGRQAYVVCPKIEDEEDVGVVQTAQQVYMALCQQLPEVRLGLLHGRVKQSERERVMQGFLQGDIQVLVSTTVIEVGVNVPNATVMVVENAERFGLAQLHQLRGRVGRGSIESWCFLCTDDHQNERLQTLCRTNDGFAIARADLEQRGPGAFLGQEQHGRADLRISTILRDPLLLDEVMQAFAQLHTDEQVQCFHGLCQLAKEKYETQLEEVVFN